MSTQTAFLTLLVVASVMTFAGAGSAATAADMTLEPTSGQTLSPGETATYKVTLSQVDNGIGAYEFTAESTAPSTVKITNATLASKLQGSLTSVTVADDGSTVSVEGNNSGDAFNATEYVMLEVTVTSVEPGTAELQLNPKYVQDTDGNSYTVDSVTGNNITVGTQQTTITKTAEPTTGPATTTTVELYSPATTQTPYVDTPGFTFLAGTSSLLAVALLLRRE